MISDRIVVLDNGHEIGFSFEDMLAYHGGGSPGGVAHAFKVLERSLPLLAPGARPERRAIVIATAFGGPGARDAFELVTRAVTEQRVDCRRGAVPRDDEGGDGGARDGCARRRGV